MVEQDFTLNRPNFLASEKNYVAKTITVPASTTGVTENGRTIVKSGTYFASPYKGLLVNDVDITDGDRVGALMIAGYYIDAKLPATVASHVTDFAKQGLYPLEEGAVTRPDFGTAAGLEALAAPVPSASTKTVSWSPISGALGYEVYKCATEGGNYVDVASLPEGTTQFTASQVGYYKVQALGDNLVKANSPLSAAAHVSTLA